MRGLSFSSLQIKLILLILIATLPAMGLMVYTDLEEYNRACSQTEAQALLVARQISNNQERLIEGTRILLTALTQLPEVRWGDPERCSALLTDLMKQYPFFANLGAAFPDGEVFCSAAPAAKPVNFADRGWFRRALASRQFTMSEYILGRITGEPLLAFSLPAVDDNGRVKSVVFAGLSLSWINQLFAREALPSGSTLMVIGRKGTILARYPEPDKWVGKSAQEVPILRTVLTRQEGGTIDLPGNDGNRRLWAFMRLSDKPEISAWVCVGIPSAVVFAETRRSLLRNLVLLVFVVLLAVLAVRRFGKSLILRPVNELLSVSRQLAEGDLTARVGPHYVGGEVGQLALAFDQMAESLQTREAERKEAEKAMQQSQARFRRLAENAHDLIYRYELTPRRGFTYINPAVTAITGYTPEEYYADPDLRYNIIHPEDRQLFEAATSGDFSAGQTLTLRWIRKDGKMIWLELRRVPVYNDDGNLIAVEGVGRDITDRKWAEEALGESEHRFRELFENMSSGVAVYEAVDGGADFIFKDFNAAATRIEQTPRKAVIGRRVTDVFPGVRKMGLLDVFSRVWKTSIPEHYPITFYKDEKHAGWRENYVYRLQSGEIVAIYDDITERKRAEEALAESEKHFRALIENGSDVITEMDTQGTIRYESPSVERELGYRPDELIGRSVFDFIHPEDLGRTTDILSEAFANPGDNYSIEFRLRDRDGSWRVLEAAGKFVTTPEGFTGVIVNSRDVTERRRAEEKIANLNRTLRAIRSINQMIVQEKDPEKLIHRTSEILVEHAAYHAAMLILVDQIGKPIAHAAAGMKEVFQPMVEHLTKGTLPPCCKAAQLRNGVLCITDHSRVCTSCPITSSCDRRDIMCIRLQHGETTYGYLSGSVVREVRIDPEEQSLFTEMAGDVAFALYNIQQDKAMQEMHKERDRFEAELRQVQKMEAIGALAGGIAHDFNNILTAVIGFTQLAGQDVDKDSLAYKNLQEVLKASARAKDLVKQILTFSHQAKQELQPVQVNLIVKETLKLLRASLPSTVEIVQHIESDTMVWSEPTQIHQIMMNLCANAAYAMREKGGTLEVNLKDVELGADSPLRHPDIKPGKYLLLEVADTGHGIDPSIKDRIFDPFFTTKERGEGTGMGLAVAHGIVKNLGGSISVSSELGKGSHFKIYMPSMSQEKKSEPEGELPIPKGKERILFVDDEPALIEMGKQALERLGYRVTCRISSIGALKLFQDRPNDFDLVITDMTMPKMTGEELAKEILRLRKDIPIFLCTGFSARLTEESAEEIGIRAFIMKPLVVADLARTIRQCLDQKK
jgi:PAS domain S-box-containing protein